MKRLLLLLFIFIFACSLILVASANDVEQSSNDDASQMRLTSSNDVEQSSNDVASQMMLASPNDVEQSSKDVEQGSNDVASQMMLTLSNDVEQGSNDVASQMMLASPNEDPTSYTLHPTPLKNYIEEKIMPIIVGVITSIIALLSTLKGVFSALKGLKDSKATFDKEQEKIRQESARELQKITEKYGEIKNELESIYKLSPQLEVVDKRTMLLAKEIANLSKIVSLGYSADKELIKDGIARECVVLANKNGELIESETV